MRCHLSRYKRTSTPILRCTVLMLPSRDSNSHFSYRKRPTTISRDSTWNWWNRAHLIRCNAFKCIHAFPNDWILKWEWHFWLQHCQFIQSIWWKHFWSPSHPIKIQLYLLEPKSSTASCRRSVMLAALIVFVEYIEHWMLWKWLWIIIFLYSFLLIHFFISKPNWILWIHLKSCIHKKS